MDRIQVWSPIADETSSRVTLAKTLRIEPRHILRQLDCTESAQLDCVTSSSLAKNVNIRIANTALSSLLTATQSAQNGSGQGKFPQNPE